MLVNFFLPFYLWWWWFNLVKNFKWDWKSDTTDLWYDNNNKITVYCPFTFILSAHCKQGHAHFIPLFSHLSSLSLFYYFAPSFSFLLSHFFFLTQLTDTCCRLCLCSHWNIFSFVPFVLLNETETTSLAWLDLTWLDLIWQTDWHREK